MPLYDYASIGTTTTSASSVGLISARFEYSAPFTAMTSGTTYTVPFGVTDWNDISGLTLNGDGSLTFGAAAAGKYLINAFLRFGAASIPLTLVINPNNSDPKDAVFEQDSSASTSGSNFATGNVEGTHAFGAGDTLAITATQYSGSNQTPTGASLQVVRIGPFTPTGTATNFLLMFVTGYNGTPADGSTHPWTNLVPYTQFGSPAQSVGCGAGPPGNQYFSAWYRAIVPGESATVATFSMGGSTSGGMFIAEVGGCDPTSLQAFSNMSVIPSSSSGFSDIRATSGTSKIGLIGATAYAKVDYDGGWCTGWPTTGYVVSTVAGTPLNTNIGTSAGGSCGGTPPWVWFGYTSGAGSLLLRALSDSHGGGGGAYACGFMTMRCWFTVNVTTKFNLVQSAYAGFGPPGGSVTLPNPPSP